MAIEVEQLLQTGTEVPERTFEFYTVSGLEPINPKTLVIPKEWQDSKSPFQQLYNKCLKPFKDQGTSALQTFVDGDGTENPDKNKLFAAEAKIVIASYCMDLLADDRNNDPTAIRTWHNINQIAPELVKRLTKAMITPNPERPNDKRNLIALVQKTHALGIISTALQLARDPDIDVVLETGYGGSDSQATSMRAEAYPIPMLMVNEQVRDFYEARTAYWILQTAVKEYKDLAGESINPVDLALFTASVKDRITQQQAHWILSPQQIDDIYRTYAIRQHPLRMRILFAENAAIALNGMDPVAVYKRTQETKHVLSDAIRQRYPKVAESLEFVSDIPWSQIDPLAVDLNEYFASLLKTGEQTEGLEHEKIHGFRGNHYTLDESVETEHARNISRLYASIHPSIFGFLINFMPPIPTLVNMDTQEPINNHPTIVMTYGGDAERHFCYTSEYLMTNANQEGFLSFIEAKAAQLHDPIEQALVRTRADKVRVCNSRLAGRQSRVSFINTIGKHLPPYYWEDDIDVAHTEEPKTSIAFLRGRLQGEETREAELTQAIQSIIDPQSDQAIDPQLAKMQKTALTAHNTALKMRGTIADWQVVKSSRDRTSPTPHKKPAMAEKSLVLASNTIVVRI